MGVLPWRASGTHHWAVPGLSSCGLLVRPSTWHLALLLMVCWPLAQGPHLEGQGVSKQVLAYLS